MSVGFIGLGIMGSRQAATLRRAGHELTVYNRTRATAERWAAEHGGHVAATPREVAERSRVVITMVVDGGQVETLLLGEDGALAGAREDALFVDMSTIAPADARRLGATLSERGHGFVDAPVSGSAPKAADGTLTIMVGGAEADVARARPYLEAMGELIVHVGEVGRGQQVKVITNAVGAANAATLAQAIVVARSEGIDLDAFLTLLGGSAGNSQMALIKGRPMIDRDYTTLFKLEHVLKDVLFCLEEARAAGAGFPAAALAGELYAAGVGRGLGERDFAAVIEVVEALGGHGVR